jgi:hypothetical protein
VRFETGLAMGAEASNGGVRSYSLITNLGVT